MNVQWQIPSMPTPCNFALLHAIPFQVTPPECNTAPVRCGLDNQKWPNTATEINTPQLNMATFPSHTAFLLNVTLTWPVHSPYFVLYFFKLLWFLPIAMHSLEYKCCFLRTAFQIGRLFCLPFDYSDSIKCRVLVPNCPA